MMGNRQSEICILGVGVGVQWAFIYTIGRRQAPYGLRRAALRYKSVLVTVKNFAFPRLMWSFVKTYFQCLVPQ
jgi:hypothetical protein